LVIGSAGWVWLRSSSFVSVERVHILGVKGPDAVRIDAALRRAALRQSTLDSSVAALRGAVADFPVVRSVNMSTSFPHTMTIRVAEQLPVAALSDGASRTAVAGDGVVLGPSLLSTSLPVLSGPAVLPLPGTLVRASSLRSYLVVLGAAPGSLDHLVTRAYEGQEGLTLQMRDGLLVYFGDDSRPHAKWFALARVLADPSSAGSRYVDVRLPERPAAGTETARTKPVDKSRASQEASLAASLDRAVGGEAEALSPATTTPTTPEATTSETPTATTPAAPEASTPETPEASTSTPETTTPATPEEIVPETPTG
jgi:cell division protein FtsQ